MAHVQTDVHAVDRELEKVRLVRDQHLTGTVVFVDGMPGCGKTLMTAIVDGLARVEVMQYTYQVEYVCVLRFLRKIDEDTATALIRLHTDLQLYNVMMSRETNFRFSDLSGVWSNPRPWRYFRRLFMPGDDAAIERIRRERPILHLVTHFLLGICPAVLTALDDQARIIEVVRHPLYMLKQRFGYMPKLGKSPRELSIWFDYQGRAVPWNALGWERKFVDSGTMDQAIFMMDEMQRLNDQVVSELPAAQRARILTIPFERFVIDPWPYMRQLETFLGTEVTKTTRRVMKKQNVPRKMFAEGIGLRVYRENGWEPPREGSTEEEEFKRRRQFAAEHATPKAMEVLDRLCVNYERTYLDGLLTR